MQVPETDIIWPYSLLKVSENKSTPRTGVQVGFAHEMVGVDGSIEGGLQPFPGFREMHRFKMSDIAGTDFPGNSNVNPYATDGQKCSVIDFWSFSVIAGASKRVWGFLYIAKRPNTGSCNSTYDLLMDYYAPQNTAGTPVDKWGSKVVVENIADAGVLCPVDSKNNSIMSVETTGQAVYFFRRGATPVSIYFKYVASPQVTTPQINTSAGAGVKPKAGMYQQGTPPVDSDFPTAVSASAGHLAASFPNPTSGGNPAGSVVFCRINDATVPAAGTGGAGPFVVSNLGTGVVLDEGTYSLAVQFEDSLSGRKTQISDNVDFTFSGTTDKKLFLDGIYDSGKFDTLNVYRSVRTQNAAGVYTGGILQLEAQITLSTTYTVSSLPMRTGEVLPSGGDIKYFRYAYQLKDASLVMQDVYTDRAAYFATMPKGGAGALLDGTMLVGNISEGADDLTGTGATRWSSSTETSVELFTAKSQYKPASVGDAVTCFRRAGQIMAGLTRNGVQFFDKSSGFVRVVPAHQGFGVVGPYAACSVGPVVYYLNYRGLKAVFPDGKLDDVRAIDSLVIQDWYSGTTGAQELTKVSMAFDPATLCLYVLNPTRQTAVQMWFSTGVVSELRDQNFGKVTQGWWQDTDGQLVPRALFLMNAPYPDAVTNTNFRPAVFMPCRTYSDKTYPESGANPPVYMFDCEATHYLSETSVRATASTFNYYDSSCTSQTLTSTDVTNAAGTANPFTASSAVAARMIGSWIYTNNVAAKNSTDEKYQIVDATTSRVLVVGTMSQAFNLAFDPVYFRWVGHPLRMTDDRTEEFLVKQPSSMGCIFTDVGFTGAKAPTYLFWNGLLYRDNDTDPLLEFKPTDREGNVSSSSLSRGDSAVWTAFGQHGILGNYLTPGIEIYLPNVEYRLVNVQVKGRMLPTDRTRRTY